MTGADIMEIPNEDVMKYINFSYADVTTSGHNLGDHLFVTEHMQAPRIVGIYERALGRLDPLIEKEEDWEILKKKNSNDIDDACYIRALQVVANERYRQNRGARWTCELNDALPKLLA